MSRPPILETDASRGPDRENAWGRSGPGRGSSASGPVRVRSILRNIDAEDVSERARAESRNREVHLPPVSVYRWWARRTLAVNAALVEATSIDRDGALLVADPFAGGGVIPLAAVSLGHRVYAQDLNPWAALGLRAMLDLPLADDLREAAAVLQQRVSAEVEAAYGTTMSTGAPGLISHTFRVATSCCGECGKRQRMFPHAMISLLVRKEKRRKEAFLACPSGHVFQGTTSGAHECPQCGSLTVPSASYTSGRVITCSCGARERLETRAQAGTWAWEVVLVERSNAKGRELDIPTAGELQAAEDARYRPSRALGKIPNGQETKVLTRHGFKNWEDLYPRRQRVLLEHLLHEAESCSSDRSVTNAVRMAVVGSAEMAGLLSRWDRYYLKSFESMAGHRFNFTTLTVEPNVWGTVTSGRGTALRRLTQLVRAAEWMQAKTRRKLKVAGPCCVEVRSSIAQLDTDVAVVEGSSESMLLDDGTVDLVLTDPPYHDDVQYSELSLPLRAWAHLSSSQLDGEAVVNGSTGQLAGGDAYGDLLTRIFAECLRVLQPDGHLVFSYANRSPQAWVSLLTGLQEAGLKAIGCELVHSENETDQAKRGVRACTMDLLLDLVPKDGTHATRHQPSTERLGAEADFLRLVGSWFLKVGTLRGNWKAEMAADLRSAEFLKP